MAKPVIGRFDQSLELVIRERIANKRTHDSESNVLVPLTCHCGDLIVAQRRYVGRHIQATVAGKAGHHRFFKRKLRCLATGRDIAHLMRPFGVSCGGSNIGS